MPRFTMKPRPITPSALQSLRIGAGVNDPACTGPGYALRYRRKVGGIYAELRCKAPGGWKSRNLGRVDRG